MPFPMFPSLSRGEYSDFLVPTGRQEHGPNIMTGLLDLQKGSVTCDGLSVET